MSAASLSGTTTPSYEYHSSRSRESISSGSSQASPPATGHSMISPFPFESSVFSSRGISPVPEEGGLPSDAQRDNYLSNALEATIMIMGLPRHITDRELRSIFIFAKDFVSVEFIPDSPLEDERLPSPKRSAIARFHSYHAAQEAKDQINSKRGEIFEGEVLQATLPISQPQTTISGRRNTTDNSSRPAMLSTSAASSVASSGRGLGKIQALQTPFSATEAIIPPAGLIGTIPPSLASSSLSGLGSGLSSLPSSKSFSSSSDYSIGPSPEYIADAFPTLTARTNGSIGPSSGKALLMESEPENNEEYDSLLSDHSRYMYNTIPVSLAADPLAAMQKPRRSTNPASMASRFSQLSLNTNNLPPLPVSMGSPATMVPGNASTLTSPISIPMSATATAPNQNIPPPYQRVLPAANPADQNPPCNTLYVGNLPANTSEDELKALFSRQRGYKRLCFRTKANGPMCFVEFEDVAYATRALTELYGRGLSNSVKGGIRLSFSKNPLGVRSNQNPANLQSPTTPVTGSAAAGGLFSTALHAPPGLPHPGVTTSVVRPNPLEVAPQQIAPLVTAIPPRDAIYATAGPSALAYRESLLASPVSYQSTGQSALGFTPVSSASASANSFAAPIAPPNIPGFLVGK
ncbi:hypothetical protein DRE_02676 [Drechslerella stenobrocha 248]|uniref:RRM domain-containing protein n=1 Tax=Drechslerella stenobrocha 248 TaxID=1043628 RepID=W7I7L2_9PEZI|nr:hypothetical protein DRE_02676 [Drechslerella stenobrocha 248]